MRRFTQCLAALVIAAAGLAGLYQAPAAALSQGVLSGNGWMGSVTFPGTSVSGVSGTMSGTAVGTGFGVCTFSDPFNGQESLISGQGVGPVGCWGSGCVLQYQRVGLQIVMNGFCASGFGFQAAGFVEPSSVLPTNSYLFQVTGVTTPAGTITIQGNMTFSPGAPVGVDPGTITPTSTSVSFNGTLTGVLGLLPGSCSLTMTGGGSESYVLGQSSLNGTCSGPGGPTNCALSWTHVGSVIVLNGNCFGPLGNTLFGAGLFIPGGGGSFSIIAEVTIL